MRVSDMAIVLQATRHGDKKYILKLYTSRHGLLTAIAHVGKSPSSKVRAATILPLSIADVEIINKQNREIQQLTEATSCFVTEHLHESIARLSIAQFMNEVMLKSLKEQQHNEGLFEFIETCVRYLDHSDDFMNLHLYFMLGLARYMGFEPQNNYSPDSPYFDCREGRFSVVQLAFPLGLSLEDSKFFSGVLACNLLQAKLNNASRQLLLEILIGYFRLHLPGFNELKSIEVLKEVLSA
jgi:DNA repair protein RecO (recombination protein O)